MPASHERDHERDHDLGCGCRAGFDRRRFLRDGAATAALVAASPTLVRNLAMAEEAPVRSLGPTRLAAVADVPAPPIVTRAQWGADESLRGRRPGFSAVSRLVVHHTAQPGNGVADPAAALRGVYRYHVRNQGWSDIGYNFVIDEAGRTYEGRWAQAYGPGEVHDGEDARGLGVIGAHTASYNTGAMGVALLGNFQYGAEPTPAALSALVELLAWKASNHGIDPTATVRATRFGGSETRTVGAISGHRDYGTTSCPGQNLYELLPAVRERVRRRLLAGTVGYRILTTDGSFATFGDVDPIGDLPSTGVRGAQVLGAAGTPTGAGAWVVAPAGEVYAFGDARFLGSMRGTRLKEPMVGMAATPAGDGYWTVASDGGIFTFGTARFFGSTGAIILNKPIVGMASTPSGGGYWMVATDGGIFAFGDAGFFGSTGAIVLNQPIAGMAPTPTGLGYWLVAVDGGIFGFGDAVYHGSLPDAGKVPVGGARSIRSSPSGQGYWIVDRAGAVYPFGDAQYFGGGVAPRAALDLVPVVR